MTTPQHSVPGPSIHSLQEDIAGIPGNRAARRAQKAADFRAQAIEALGQTAETLIEGNSGTIYSIPHPLAMSDEQQKRFAAVQRGDDLDRWPEGSVDADGVDRGGKPDFDDPTINGESVDEAIRVARAVLGDVARVNVIADGGTSNDVSLAFQSMTRVAPKDDNNNAPKLP